MAYSRCLIMRNKPRIRFKGFTEDWEQHKLSDILKVNSGKDYKHLDQGNIPVYGTGGYMLSVNESLSNIDAIGIGRKGTIDKPQYLKAPFWTVDTLFYLTALDHHSILFLYYLIQLIPWKKYDESTGVPSLSKTTIDNISGYVPLNSKEEELISTLFNQLDKSITLHQRKLEKLKLAKKALLQKLFPKNGSQFPEIRFKGFTDAWEQRKLGDVTKIKTGSRNQQDSVANGKYPFFIRSEKIEKLDVYDFDTEAILVPGDGRIGEIFHYYNGKFALHQRVYKVDDFKGVDAFYLLYLFQCKFKEHALRLNAQGTVPSLRLPMFTEWNIDIPSLQEQICIGRFLNKIDLMITLHQRKLDKLQEVKKGLLQKMFV